MRKYDLHQRWGNMPQIAYFLVINDKNCTLSEKWKLKVAWNRNRNGNQLERNACMLAPAPVLIRQSTNCCQEEVPYGGNVFEVDHKKWLPWLSSGFG